MSRRGYAVILFVSLLLCYAYFFPHWADWSQNSRFDLVLAIVDQGTLSIDAYVANTGDYARYEGHTYSDKAPGLSFLGVPVYGLYRAVARTEPVQALMERVAHNPAFADTLNEQGTGLLREKVYQALALYVLTVATVGAPSALLGVIVYWLLGSFTRRDAYRMGLALAFGLGTLAFPYAWAYYGHQLSAVLLFAAFAALHWMRTAGKSPWWGLAGVGFLLGYAVITEYPAAIVAGLIFIYAIYVLRNWRKVALMIAGGIPPGLLLAAYDLAIFGTLLPVGYRYSELWQDQHSTGFLSLTVPRLETLGELTFGLYRGLFVTSPYLLLGVAGFVLLWRQRRAFRAELLVSGGAALGMLLFNSASSMWWGGFAFGPRYMIAMLPFLAWMVVGVLEAQGAAGRWVVWLTWALVVVSAVLIGANSIAGQSFPEETVSVPTAYALERLADGDLARNLGMALGLKGWASLIPLVGCAAVLAGLVIWKGRQTPGTLTFSEEAGGALAH